MRHLRDRINNGLPKATISKLFYRVINETGVSKMTFYRYLKGKSNDQRIGISIAAALGITFEQLLDNSFDIPPVTELKPPTAEKDISQVL